MGKEQHVTTHPDGGWQVKGAGNSRATVRTNTGTKYPYEKQDTRRIESRNAMYGRVRRFYVSP